MTTFVSTFLPVGDRLSDPDYADNAVQTVLYFPKLAIFAETTTIYSTSYKPNDSHGPIGLTYLNESVNNGIILSVSKRSASSFLCLSAIVKDSDPDSLSALKFLQHRISVRRDVGNPDVSADLHTLEHLLIHNKMYTTYTVYSVTDAQCELKYVAPTSVPLIGAIAVEGTPFIAATGVSKDGYNFTFDCLLDEDNGGKLIPVRTVKQKTGDVTSFVDTALYPAINMISDRPSTACTTPATTVKDFVHQVSSRNTRAASDVLYKFSAVHLDSSTKTVYYREYDLKSTNLRVIHAPGAKKSDKHKAADSVDYSATIESFKPTVHYTRTLIVNSAVPIVRIAALVMPYTQNSLLNDKYAVITDCGDLQLYSRREQADGLSASIKVFSKKLRRAFLVPLRDGVIMLTSSTGESALVGIDGKWNSDKNIEEMRGHLCKIFIDEFLATNPNYDQQNLRHELSKDLLPPIDSFSKSVQVKKHIDKLAIITTFSYNSTVTCASTAPDHKLVCLGLTSRKFIFVPTEPIKNRALLSSYRGKLSRETANNLQGQYTKYDVEAAVKDTVAYLANRGLNGQQLMERVSFFFAFSKDVGHSDFLPVQESVLDVANHNHDAPSDTIEMLSILASVTKDEVLGKSSLAAYDPDLGKSMINDLREVMRSTLRTVAVPGVGSTAIPGEGALQTSDHHLLADQLSDHTGTRSKRVEFLEPTLRGAKLSTAINFTLADLSAIETRGLTEANGSHVAAPIHSASGLYQTDRNVVQEPPDHAHLDSLIEENFKNHLVDATRNLLESGFDCQRLFNAVEEDVKTAILSMMNVSDLNEDSRTARLADLPLVPHHADERVTSGRDAMLDEYPAEPGANVPVSLLSAAWLGAISNSLAVRDTTRHPVQLPVLSNLGGAKLLLTHYKEIQEKKYTLVRNKFTLALELLLADDPLFLAASCSARGLSSMKNSYYLTDYIRREHEEISQCPYCSVFSIRCNLFQLSSRGETVCSTTERLLCEILDSSHEIRQDYAVRIIAGMEAFLTRVYQEDLNTAMTAPGEEPLASLQYTQFPQRLITFVPDGGLVNSLTFTQDIAGPSGAPQKVRYELIGTISQDCLAVYKLDTVGRWCMLEGSDSTGLTISIRPNDVADNSFYAVYKQVSGSEGTVGVPLDSLHNIMTLAHCADDTLRPSAEIPDSDLNPLSDSSLKKEISLLKSQLEYRTRREERATEKAQALSAENHELKKKIESLKVDLKFEEMLTKSELLRQQSAAENAEQDRRLDELLRLQTELRQRESEEKILILELEEARRRIADLVHARETADIDEYDVILKHCYTTLGGDEADVPEKRKELLLMLQKQCIAVSTEYDLNNPYRKGSMRLSYGPARASQMRMSRSRADARSIAQSLEAFHVSDLQDNELGNRKVIATTLLPVICFFIGIAIIVIFAMAFNRNDVV
ncbi:Hypothetical protein DHA2_152716 [Giardia duodenalis]|uniref:Uncharacterized protein n=1 Tax=Giardia intestinalis TaxID=5741 RepID=V6TAM0_GIAIN|nr:Hypothetical protein DHA2_152716 [Giardia intestinalis]